MATSSLRITGLASGMDIDSIVESQLYTYKNKINTEKQKKEVLEIQQELYRTVMSDCNNFYNKYLDITKDSSVLKSKNYKSISYNSSNSNVATAEANASVTSKDTFDIEVTQMATSATTTVTLNELKKSGDTLQISYADKDPIEIDISKCTTDKELGETINKALKVYGMKAYYSEFAKGVVIETTEVGSELEASGKTIENTFTVKIGNVNKDDKKFTESSDPNAAITVTKGKDLEAVITKTTGGVKQSLVVGKDIKASGNSVSVDGVVFNMNSVGTTTLTGTKDITAAKNMIKEFVNDYNTLMKSLNTLVNEKRDRNYQPLTDAQKEEMTESQIEKWEAKVKTGQLARDSDITRIINSLKRTTQEAVKGVGLSLENIGIKPVSDYGGNNNGTFEIDEDALTKALEENLDEVVNLLMGYPEDSASLSETEKYNSKGIFQRMKDVFASETVSASSSLAKKAGLVNTSTFTNNDITKSISSYEKKIKQMESNLASKQQALYSKWASVEKMMNNYNSQANYLASYLGS